MMQHLFQILPIVLACVAAVACSVRFGRGRRHHDRLAMALATLSSVLLIVAQTSWWTTYLIEHSLQGTEFANAIWTIFNSTTMVTFILMAQPWRKA
jgi:hypothetical protein